MTASLLPSFKNYDVVGPAQAYSHLAGSKQSKEWLLSQSYFGWPSNRPRLYTVLIHKSFELKLRGVNEIDRLYRLPSLSAKDNVLLSPEPQTLYCVDLTHQSVN